jgi:hypothetical protein
MSESKALIYATIVTAAAASFAALAGTAQSYIAWSGRNDTLKATLLSVVVQQCSDIRGLSPRIQDGLLEFYRKRDAGQHAEPPNALRLQYHDKANALTLLIEILNRRDIDIPSLPEEWEKYDSVQGNPSIPALDAFKKLHATYSDACVKILQDQLTR